MDVLKSSHCSWCKYCLVWDVLRGVCDVKMLWSGYEEGISGTHSWLMGMTVFNHVYSANVDVCGFMGREVLHALDMCDGVVVVRDWWGAHLKAWLLGRSMHRRV